MLKQETLPIIIKRCWNNTGFLNLLWCKLEKGDFAISLFSSNFFFKHLLFSLSTKLVFVRSQAFKSSTVPSVCLLKYFAYLLKHFPPSQTHMLILRSLKRKKKDNITTSCVSVWKFDSHEHITHEAWAWQASLSLLSTVLHSLTLISFRKSLTTLETWGWMMWKGVQQWVSVGGRSNRLSSSFILEAGERDWEEN